MLSAQTYLEHIKRDGDRIAKVAKGNLDEPVPSCPGNTVDSMLLHVAGVVHWWTAALQQNAEPKPDWSALSGDMLACFGRVLPAFLAELGSHDPDQPTWTWGSDKHARFAYRRVAQELSIHRWDFENAVGTPLPIDPALAADGVDELLQEFIGEWEGESAAQKYAGSGQRLRFEATDLPRSWTIATHPDRFEVSEDGQADVTARGTASNIDLFVWGRVPPSALRVSGDGSLLERWQEKVKI